MELKYEENRFLYKEFHSNQQYYEMYRCRLEQLKPLIVPQLPQPICSHLNNMVSGIKCSIVGIIYKEFSSRKSILQEYKEIGEDSQNVEILSISDSDKLYMEYGTGLVELIWLSTDLFSTVIVIGLQGILDSQKFLVEGDPYFPIISIPEPLPLINNPYKIVFISNLQINHSNLPFSKLVQYLNGKDLLVLLGNNFVPQIENEHDEMISFYEKLKKENYPLSKLESFLKTCKVQKTILMPGNSDPCSISLPQQPYHSVLIENPNIIKTTNPCLFNINEISFLCNSGESPLDISKTTSFNFHESQIMLLKWLHLAPSSPDHLPSYPFKNKDLLVINKLPNIFICGESDTFKYSIINNILIISVPKFNLTSSIVEFDLKTQEINLITL